MSLPIRSVTVYCSSSNDIADHFLQAAADLGRLIAQQGWALVYGGNDCGMMGALSRAARAGGGAVIGVTPQTFINRGVADTQCSELIVTSDMRQRKAIMEDRGDALIAMPGGIGTLEEFFEVLVGRSLGYHNKPLVLVNHAHFFRPLLDMLELGISAKFVRPASRKLFYTAASSSEAIGYLRQVTLQMPPITDAVPAEPSAQE